MRDSIANGQISVLEAEDDFLEVVYDEIIRLPWYILEPGTAR